MKRLVSLALIFIFALASCTPVSGEAQKENSAQNSDGTFKISIYTDKDVYSADEAVLCRAVVEYVGDGQAKTIYSSDPLVGFGLKDGKYFDGGYAVSDVLITTEFKKGKPVAYEFSKSGGWSGEDSNAEFYKEFYSQKELILPPGEYEISAKLDGFFDQNDYQGSKYEISASVKIKVG